jgi:cytochrome c biogenesis protein CcmG/thiol:disulfide interchange protein DsbE
MPADSPAQTLGVLALVVGLVGGFALLPRVLHKQPTDAPDFALQVVANGAQLPGDQTRVHLGDLRGSAVLLDFWATWCGPCRAEAPIVDRVARRWRDKGVMVVGVNEDAPDQGDPRAFALDEGLTYPIVRDPGSQTMRKYDADSLPTLVVVSRTGKVIAVRTGITEDAELERLIRQAL